MEWRTQTRLIKFCIDAYLPHTRKWEQLWPLHRLVLRWLLCSFLSVIEFLPQYDCSTHFPCNLPPNSSTVVAKKYTSATFVLSFGYSDSSKVAASAMIVKRTSSGSRSMNFFTTAVAPSRRVSWLHGPWFMGHAFRPSNSYKQPSTWLIGKKGVDI